MLYLVGDSNTAKTFVLIDAKSQHYYKSNLQTTWKSLDAWVYPMTVENLTKLYDLKEQVEKGLEVLFLPIEPYVTGQAKYLGLEKFRKHYLYKPWVGSPKLSFLDRFLDLWVSEGGCNHADLQDYISQANVWLTSSAFDPYEFVNQTVKLSSKNKVSSWETNPEEMLVFQRTRQLKKLKFSLMNILTKKVQIVESKKPKRPSREEVLTKRYRKKRECGLRTLIEHKLQILESYEVRKNKDLETAVFTNIDGSLCSVKDFLLKEFGSKYLNIPFVTYEIEIGGKVVGGQLTINLTELSRTTIADFVYSTERMYENTFSYGNFYFEDLKDSEFKRLQTRFDYRCYFDWFKDTGLFFTLGLNSFFEPFVKWDSRKNRYETKVYQHIGIGRELTYSSVYRSVSYWFEEHTDTVDSVKYKERQWLNREVIESDVPSVNTNIIYVCYLPDSGVIKVGRTENWVSRRGVYTRSSGSNPKTTGRMRLCYFWETFKIGDSVIDKYIMFCAEDHLKRLASSCMTLVEGKEYFEGCDINEFVSLVKDYFSKIDLETLLRIRSLSKLKQFAQNEHYDTERLIVELRRLANI